MVSKKDGGRDVALYALLILREGVLLKCVPSRAMTVLHSLELQNHHITPSVRACNADAHYLRGRCLYARTTKIYSDISSCEKMVVLSSRAGVADAHQSSVHWDPAASGG